MLSFYFFLKYLVKTKMDEMSIHSNIHTTTTTAAPPGESPPYLFPQLWTLQNYSPQAHVTHISEEEGVGGLAGVAGLAGVGGVGGLAGVAGLAGVGGVA